MMYAFRLGRACTWRRCFGGLLFTMITFLAGAQLVDKDPKNAAGWFRRADDRMNLRMPGSTPFHMKVAFHAFPGAVFDKEESSQIISGDGTYEETWVEPKKWRRQVTLGSYHAVEVQSARMRKMQGSSDYEPSRVLMLLEALLYPIPRDLFLPELMEGHKRWKTENGTVGDLSYVKISRTSGPADELHTYLFLPNGDLVQSIEGGIVTSWQNRMTFGGRLVPRHFSVQGGTRDLLTGDVTVEPADTVDTAVFELLGEPAEPGMTLRPIQRYEDSLSLPNRSYSWWATDGLLPGGSIIREILDRHGVTREVELLYSPNPAGAAPLLSLMRGQKFHPATIDKSPCEFVLEDFLIRR